MVVVVGCGLAQRVDDAVPVGVVDGGDGVDGYRELAVVVGQGGGLLGQFKGPSVIGRRVDQDARCGVKHLGAARIGFGEDNDVGGDVLLVELAVQRFGRERGDESVAAYQVELCDGRCGGRDDPVRGEQQIQHPGSL